MGAESQSARFYQDLHWGLEHREVIPLGDYLLLPEWTAVLGRPDRLLTSSFVFQGRKLAKGYLVVNPQRKDLFVVGASPPPAGRYPRATLGQIAARAGGRRARLSYPDVEAIDLGPLQHIDYIAEKKTREKVLYLHEVLDRGEGKRRAKHRCHLAWDGHMYWIIGGDYDVTAHGIVG